MLSRTSIRATLLISALLTSPLGVAQQTDHSAHAQHNTSQSSGAMDHSQHSGAMDHSQHSVAMDHSQHSGAMDHSQHAGMTAAQPTEAGQDAFAAIQEVVAILSADPNTDWSQVNIDALRDHLVDMHLVTLYAKVQSEPVTNGARYLVTGQGETAAAIKRMVTAHAKQVSNDSPWQAQTLERDDGVELTVTSTNTADVAKIRGLGFAGFMVQGNHHQPHHLMMAKGAFGHSH